MHLLIDICMSLRESLCMKLGNCTYPYIYKYVSCNEHCDWSMFIFFGKGWMPASFINMSAKIDVPWTIF